MKAQTIQIDSLFTSDGEIFPFEPDDTICGLSISGSVTLLSDTSLVRVILTDNSGNEWMVYEAYPMIVDDTSFNIIEECDETCYLEGCIPYFLNIFITDATFEFSHYSFEGDRIEFFDSLSYITKMLHEVNKTDAINQYITNHNWNWVAGMNDLVDLFYSSKKNRFGPKYNLLGYDYYASGIYKTINSCEIYTHNSSMINSFDWREKHDANLSNSKYFDQNPDYPQVANGWMTKVKNQDPCGACTAFGSVAALEALTNLYFNYHVDGEDNLLLSERDAFNCSKFDPPGTEVGCICAPTWGKLLIFVMDYITTTGVVNEECFPWIPNSTCCRGEIPDCSPINSGKCEEADIRVKIKPDNRFSENASPYETLIERLKTKLINNGPIICGFDFGSYAHVMALVGFGEDPVTGELFWIFKDSNGTLNQHYGYQQYSHAYFLDKLMNPYYYFDTSLSIDPSDYLQKQFFDKDKDGYWNWGIGDIPHSFPCSNDEDWNDNNNRIGPCDENFIETSVKPEMEVTYGVVNGITVSNHDIIYVSGNSLTDIYYTFIVRNLGNAQLNFQKVSIPLPPHAYIEIDFQNHADWFEYDGSDYLDTAICMYSNETFQIKLNSDAEPGDLAHFRIHVDEFDIEDFEFTLVFNGCITQPGYEPIYGETFWDKEYRTQLQDVHVMTDAILTISGEVILSSEADIIVEPGGKLIIDGGKLTSSCGSLWNGIDVWGDPRMHQLTRDQGMVEIKNGGMIEYADTAIATARFINLYYSPSGGIVSCKDAVFKDNNFDVIFFPYTNTHPVPPHKIIGNVSRFTRTKFETTNDYYEIMHSAPNGHMKLNEVGGIRFAGCTFYNSSTQSDYSRGIGIESNHAGYLINSYCAEDISPCPEKHPSTFENLDYGIRAFNNNDYFPIRVDSADFIHNRRGMYLGLINHPMVVKNRFDLSDPAGIWSYKPIIGLYLDEFTTGYVVEENQFSTNTTMSESFGIHLLNNGPEQNEIYNNSFTSLSTGIMAVGDNRLEDTGVGLCIKCNDFTDCIDDISVTPAKDENENLIITDNTGIALLQGEEGDGNDLAAGNTFSEDAENNYINDDGCRKINYTHHNENSTQKKVRPAPTAGDMDVNPDNDADYSNEESCPSHLTGGGITLSQEKLLLNAETELISAYQDTLTAMIDGGNTESLNYEVLTSYPEEALVIRQNLINESPYLSDTVMISAIEKEDVLPGAMIRDVLVQNPQAPKSNIVMNALNQRQDTIPGYMMEEILEGLAVYGEKELLEQQMGQHIAKRDMAWRNLNLYFKGDTANTEAYIDSLITMYQNENRPEAKYNLCFMHLSREDSSSLFNTLSDIPIEFDLSMDDLFIHNQYLDLFGILWDVKTDSTGLDSIQIQSLYSLSAPIHSVPANYAFNLLITKGLIEYNEPVYFVEPLKSVTAPALSPKVNKSPVRLLVFPNPADNYFIVQYDLNGFMGPGLLAISDMKGRELKHYGLKDLRNQVVIGTGEYPSGIYLISLKCGYKVVDSQKISIIR